MQHARVARGQPRLSTRPISEDGRWQATRGLKRARGPWNMTDCRERSLKGRQARRSDGVSRLERGAAGNLASGGEAPQRNGQSSRESDDANAPHALAAVGEALVEPMGELAVGLQPEPSPRQLHQQRAHALVAGFADALVDPAVAAVVR